MRDKEFNKALFLEQIEKFFSSQSSRTLELRAQVVDNPNFLGNYYLVLPNDLKGLVGLAFASWWVPQELGILIREDIREKRLKRLNLEDQTFLSLFLENKALMINFLEETSLWHTRDFFGNFIQEALYQLTRLRFRRINTKVSYPQRKRGYHDHGTLVPSSKWLPRNDFTLTEQQNEIEENRKSQEDTLMLIFGFLS